MKAMLNRKALTEAFAACASVVPTRTPKPVLQNARLDVTDDGATIQATDMEVGIRHRVLGAKCEAAGSVLLPANRFGSILRTMPDEEIAIETDGDTLVIRGLHAEFKLPSEDPTLFPEVPESVADASHWTVEAAALRQAIRRTMFACDIESTRYALGGVLFEPKGDGLNLVATDGRRLAKQSLRADAHGKAPIPPVVPVKALKLVERVLDDGTVTVSLDSQAVLFATESVTIYSRTVEGRFPRYQDVFPKEQGRRLTFDAAYFRGGIEQAAIATSDESRGVDFAFEAGRLTLQAQTADVGSSRVELQHSGDGASLTIAFDPRYVVDALRVLEGDVELEVIDPKSPAILRAGADYAYVIMPLTRDR